MFPWSKFCLNLSPKLNENCSTHYKRGEGVGALVGTSVTENSTREEVHERPSHPAAQHLGKTLQSKQLPQVPRPLQLFSGKDLRDSGIDTHQYQEGLSKATQIRFFRLSARGFGGRTFSHLCSPRSSTSTHSGFPVRGHFHKPEVHAGFCWQKDIQACYMAGHYLLNISTYGQFREL